VLFPRCLRARRRLRPALAQVLQGLGTPPKQETQQNCRRRGSKDGRMLAEAGREVGCHTSMGRRDIEAPARCTKQA
jgi:hypothetical protein